MIGLFDSGVGGLYSLCRLRGRFPAADICYFGDTRHLPYGEKEPAEILSLARRAVRFLRARGASAVLCACGTVSSVALPRLREEYDIPLYGILHPTAEKAAAHARMAGGHIALLGTQATVAAGAFATEIHRFAPHAPLHSLPCPAFVPLSEAGITAPADPRAASVAARTLAPLGGLPIRTVVLGCTHFSRLRDLIGGFFPAAALIDGATEGADAIAEYLPAAGTVGNGETHLFTSGDREAFARAAAPILCGIPHTVEAALSYDGA